MYYSPLFKRFAKSISFARLFHTVTTGNHGTVWIQKLQNINNFIYLNISPGADPVSHPYFHPKGIPRLQAKV